MPTPIVTLPIHSIEQARALAGLLRAYIDDQQPDTNDGQDWKPDPDLAGVAALYAHLDAGIDAAGKPRAPAPLGTLIEAGELYLAGYDGEIDGPVSGILIEMTDGQWLRAAAESMLGATVEIRRLA